MKKDNLWNKIWDVLYPLLMYCAVLLISFYIAQLILGKFDEKYMYCQIIATAVTLPAIYFSFYKTQLKEAYAGKNMTLIMILTVPVMFFISVGLNNIILMMPFSEKSPGYSEATAGFYGASIIVQIIGTGILTPILEEMVFRGIIFGRLRRMMKPVLAIIVSALFFAVVHWNIVQFPYALLIGVVLAILVELTKSVWTAIVGHALANIVAIIRTEFGILKSLMDKSSVAWSISIIMLLVGVALLIFCINKENKENK